ncbi:MAG: AMP-binding protein [Chitinivibrionales bacterium]|nr:AMP-binding protein [Chitinivibrionales bacterium]
MSYAGNRGIRSALAVPADATTVPKHNPKSDIRHPKSKGVLVKDVTYWNERRETMEREALEALQLEGLRQAIDRALHTAFYRDRLRKAGITAASDIKTLDDVRRIPFTTKDDLREAYPNGLLAVEPGEVIRLHTSSGTTGTPTVIYHTQNDIDNWTELVARCIVATGAGRGDVFQNMTTYGLFTGGLGLHYGAEKVGMLVIPASSGNTLRQLKLMQDFGTTVVHATPSYLLHISTVVKDQDIPRDALSIRRAFLGAEPYSESTRCKIEQLWDIDVYNSYGLSEMNGPGVSFECVHKLGMHTWEDSYLMEIVDCDSLEPLPDGDEGEIVFTTLQREATPLLRYRTRDLSSVVPGPCPCGRTHRRLSRIMGRSDDMLIINGVNVFPSQIETVLMGLKGVGTNYRIVIEKRGNLDRLRVDVEMSPEMFTDDVLELNHMRDRIEQDLKASILVNPAVKLHEPGVLPVSEGKAVRVVDNRPRD